MVALIRSLSNAFLRIMLLQSAFALIVILMSLEGANQKHL
jgi:hypothetical protein